MNEKYEQVDKQEQIAYETWREQQPYETYPVICEHCKGDGCDYCDGQGFYEVRL